MTEQNCPTGCANSEHMVECFNCGAKYHMGLIHFCPTSVIVQPQINWDKFKPKTGIEKEVEDLVDALKKPIHCHVASFGSELACKECNPVCHEKHQGDNPNRLQWCGAEGCPMNPNRPPSPELQKEMDVWDRANANDWEEAEDELRKLGRKSIRYGGKYKGRHHGSKQKEC